MATLATEPGPPWCNIEVMSHHPRPMAPYRHAALLLDLEGHVSAKLDVPLQHHHVPLQPKCPN
jgi:hypothetical protein